MFTSGSRFVPAQFKEKLIDAIRAERPGYRFARDRELDGRRWRDDEECFQAAMQVLLGLNFDQDRVLEIIASFAARVDTGLTSFNELARQALSNAASCDWHYTYEKDWGDDRDYEGDRDDEENLS